MPTPCDSVIRVTLDGKTDAFPVNTTVQTVISRLLDAPAAAAVLGVMQGGVCRELNESLTKDCELTSLTYRDEEGRRIYERSLRFLMLAATLRLHPGRRVRVLNSVGYGLYVRLESELTHAQVREIEAEMRRMAEADLPFEKEHWTREQAVQYFEKMGWTDKAELMRYRPRREMIMYRMGGLCEYFYGAMLPSTGWVKTFSLKPHFPGMVLMMPSPADPSQSAKYHPHTKFLRVFGQSQEWCHILGANNAADVNRMIQEGKLREFIRVNEALHDKSLSYIADEITSLGAKVVMIFGPSSSGKTTFANRLAVHLRVLGRQPRLISLDDFYLDRSILPLEKDGKPDLESIDALDVPLLTESLEALLSGEKVEMPQFDFQISARSPETHPLQMGPDDILLVEGIHGMNDRITSEIPEQLMYGIYVSALSCINLDDHNRIRTTDVRLLRRIVRDVKMRNTSPEKTIDMWPKVRAGEERWIFPYQERADVMFNTSLHYELPVLKTIAYEMLLAIPQSAPEYLAAHRLLKNLNYFLPVDGKVMDEIPPLSILREFVGECSFYDIH